jgi:hypothetical protein
MKAIILSCIVRKKQSLLMIALSLLTGFLYAQRTGETLFRAVYFGEGAAATAIPELNGISIGSFTSNANDIQETHQIQDRIVSQINSMDANFFESFRQAITSKNHVLVRSKLDEGKAKINAASTRLGYTRNAEFEAKLTAEVTKSIPPGASYEGINQALRDYFREHAGNTGETAKLGGLIHHWVIAAWITVYEWIWDADEYFSTTYKDRLVSSIVKNW